MLDLMSIPARIRNVAILGHLHHGKTSLLDVLVRETHSIDHPPYKKPLRYTDVSLLEREREIGLRSMPMSLVLPNSSGKSLVVNFIDCPGHVNFFDETACALRAADGVVLVVDAAEGVMSGTELAIKMALRENLPLILVINKIDRLIIELKLPPTDAYYKLRHTIEEINAVISGSGSLFRFSPELGNVCFAMSMFGSIFTLESFARKYSESFSIPDYREFARRLWGDVYFNSYARKFKKTPSDSYSRRSFVQFILEPIYKLFSHVNAF
jgi:U5 small nuclear ribonucleoprotein component